MIKKNKYFLELWIVPLLIIFTVNIKSQTLNFSGIILDSLSGRPVNFAKIRVINHNLEMQAEKGYFKFNLPVKDSLHILITAQGYANLEERIKINILDGVFEKKYYLRSLDTKLKQYDMSAVSVYGNRFKDLTPAGYEIKFNQLSGVPVIIESDILKILQVLPGLSRENDASAKIIIRGGAHYQHSIMIDDVPVFNTFHMGGLTSVFNSDIIGKADLYPSCYPPEYGGVASSVLNIRTRDKYTDNYNIKGTLGLLTSGATYANKIGDGYLILSGRRTYLDFIAWLSKANFSYNYYDLFGKYKYMPDSNNIISVNILYNRDNYDILLNSRSNTEYYYYYGEQKIPNWGNLLPYIKWEYYPSINQRINLLLYYSGSWLRGKGELKPIKFERLDRFNIDNNVDQTGIKAKYNLELKNIALQAGLEYAQTEYNYFWNIRSATMEGTVRPPQKIFFDFAPPEYQSKNSRNNFSGFIQGKMNIFDNIGLNLGGRFDCFNDGNTFLNPFINMEYSLKIPLKFGITYGEYVQSLNVYNDLRAETIFESFSLPFFPANNIFPKAKHFTLSLKSEELLPGLIANIESYILEKKDLPFISAINREIKYFNESGIGVEFFLHYQTDEINSIIGYSLGRSIRQEGKARLSGNYDQRYLLKLLFGYKLSEIFEISVNYNLNTGMPYSMPSGIFPGKFISDIEDQPGALSWFTLIEPPMCENPIYGYRNNERSPFYNRLDLTLIYSTTLWGMDIKPYLTIINLLYQKNPFIYSVRVEEHNAHRSLQGFPLVPIIGANFEIY